MLALVTGGTRGIGLAIAERLAKDGYSVGILYEKNHAAAAAARERLQALGAKVAVAAADVADFAQVDAAVKQIEAALGGRVTTVVNNAGVVDDGLFMMTAQARIDRLYAVHTGGAMNVVRATMKAMIAKKSGVIVNLISPSALRGRPGQSGYAAAKGALLAWTRTLAVELGPLGIRVNALCPGLIDTDMVRGLAEPLREELRGRIAMKRFGTADEVAAAASLLLRASYMQGAVLSVDGGL